MWKRSISRLNAPVLGTSCKQNFQGKRTHEQACVLGFLRNFIQWARVKATPGNR
jgi:hypothetical protein